MALAVQTENVSSQEIIHGKRVSVANMLRSIVVTDSTRQSRCVGQDPSHTSPRLSTHCLTPTVWNGHHDFTEASQNCRSNTLNTEFCTNSCRDRLTLSGPFPTSAMSRFFFQFGGSRVVLPACTGSSSPRGLLAGA